MQTGDVDYVELAAEIVAAYVSNNSVQIGELPGLIAQVHGAITQAATGAPAEPAEELKPAVPIKKSVTPEYLICLDDGKKFKSLKRHLAQLGMTPAEYRAKWGLPADYPMVAPAYAEQRSALAKSIGLGQARRRAAETDEGETAEAAPAPAPARRGRRKADAEPVAAE